MARRKIRDYIRTVRASRTMLKLIRTEYRADPYPLLRKVQRIGRVIFIPSHNWAITRYDDAAAILRARTTSDSATSSARRSRPA